MNAVALDLCVALIREFLSGYRGYPNNEAGEKRFARALQEVVVSVQHARGTLAEFTGIFPTVKEIQDQAVNLRPKYELVKDPRDEWERQYGPPVAIDVSAMTGNTRHDEMWRKLKVHLGVKGGKWPGWPQMAKAARELGYEDYAQAWERS
jgi:hypothetical protein